ncbi:FAD-dependent monooxygenase [Nguyenibacter vanlangensis]|uniref:FAD-dependent monooxygenase n=1 Tax=Nguyenibacter vanlangensis TaxID=1216886 RepID=A0ABZ3D316_9PROT
MVESVRIGIVGAGLGGVAAAGLLGRAGYDVTLYEQAPSFSRLGAGIQFGPNVMKIMRRLGLEERIEAVSCHPDFWFSRNGADGAYLSRIPLNAQHDRYGATYVTIHRGDVHEIMLGAVDPAAIRFGKKLVDFEENASGVVLSFEDGTIDTVEMLIGADGLNSRVRETLLGPEDPLFTGWIGHRALIPAARLSGLEVEPCVKWWSSDRHMMAYFLDRNRDEFYFVTGEPAADWPRGVAWQPSTRAALHESFKGYCDTVQAYIEAAESVTKWPLFTRDPLPLWHKGRVVLLGDACHPMKPHMAQGAAMAIEDAAVLVRCITELGVGDMAATFETYRRHRVERASRVQQVSNANTWLRADEDPYWVYGHDVYAIDLNA